MHGLAMGTVRLGKCPTHTVMSIVPYEQKKRAPIQSPNLPFIGVINLGFHATFDLPAAHGATATLWEREVQPFLGEQRRKPCCVGARRGRLYHRSSACARA